MHQGQALEPIATYPTSVPHAIQVLELGCLSPAVAGPQWQDGGNDTHTSRLHTPIGMLSTRNGGETHKTAHSGAYSFVPNTVSWALSKNHPSSKQSRSLRGFELKESGSYTRGGGVAVAQGVGI